MTRPWRVLFVCSAAVFVVALDTTIVNVAFPSIRETFAGVDEATLSWVLSAYGIAFAALLVTAGRLADLYGRRRVFFAGLLCFTAASVACGFAPSPAWLVAGRIVQGAGGAALFPASLALVLPEFPVHRRSVAVAVWGAVGAVAVAAGPSIGGAVIQAAGWRWAFLLNAPVGLLSWAAGRGLLVESRDPDARGRPDVVGVALLTLGMTALALAIVQGPGWGWDDRRVWLSLLVAAVALGSALRRSARHPSPVVDLALFGIASFRRANAATLLFGMAFAAMLLASAVFLQTVWRYPVRTAGLALTPGPLLAGLTGILVGRVADRLGHRTFVVPGAALFATGQLLLLARVGVRPDFVADWLPGLVATGLGVGMVLPTLSSAAVRSLPAARFGVGSAVNTTARQFGTVLGVAAFVALSSGVGVEPFRRVWLFTAVCALASGAIATRLGRTVVAVPEPAAATA